MTTEIGQSAPIPNSGAEAPPPDSDAAKYDALRKELGIEPEGGKEPPAPAPTEPSAPAEPDPRAKPEHVPFAEHENVQKALREAREQTKAANDQLARFMRIVEDARARQPAEPGRKEEEPKLPDVMQDPIGHFTGRIAQLEGLLQQAQQGGQATTQQMQAWQAQQALHAAVNASAQDIRNPQSTNHKADYDAACEHLASVRMKQLDLLYPDDSTQVQAYAQQLGFVTARDLKLAQLRQDEEAVAYQALQLGVSPAMRYYELSLAAGYQPNGKAPNGAERGKQQLETAKKGQAAALSISGGNSGRKGADDMSISDLSDLFLEDSEAANKIFEQWAKAGKLG